MKTLRLLCLLYLICILKRKIKNGIDLVAYCTVDRGIKRCIKVLITQNIFNQLTKEMNKIKNILYLRIQRKYPGMRVQKPKFQVWLSGVEWLCDLTSRGLMFIYLKCEGIQTIYFFGPLDFNSLFYDFFCRFLGKNTQKQKKQLVLCPEF